MTDAAAERQIRQMAEFIKAEAREKAEEIRMKTKADADLEKQMAVLNAKTKLAEEYDRKEKQAAVEKRILASKKEREERGRLLSARDALVRDLSVEAKAALASAAAVSGTAYAALLKGLIKQGLRRLAGDSDVTVYVRPQDEKVAAQVAPVAADELVKELAAQNEKRTIRVKVSVDPSLSSSIGGCILASLDGKIRCNNTLEERLNLVTSELTPVIRDVLFPSARAEPRQKPPVQLHGGHSAASAAPAPAPAPKPAPASAPFAHAASSRPAAAPTQPQRAPAPAAGAAAGVFDFPSHAPAPAPAAADPFATGAVVDPFATSGW